MRAVGSNAQGKRITAFEALAATVLLLPPPCAANGADQPEPERLQFTRAEGEITLDGRLDEASWHNATPLTRFFVIDPANLGVPAVSTSASFLYDERNVYVAIRASDPNPTLIRAPIVRRDQVLADQDYVEVLLDPLNTRRSALFFRVNARGIVTDGQYDDSNRLTDYSPDLNFDVATSLDAEGWTAELRIPLSSLRYQPGIENPWAFVVYRNVPREHVVTISSAPIPRGEACVLCYADVLSGVAVTADDSALSVIPHVTYSRLDDRAGAGNDFDAGIDLTWKPRANTVIDATVFPDFSQIEADAPQLTGNTQFALALTEKRPFFLEGTDLLTTQVPAIYTRAFTDPDAGVRITDRSSSYEYTALALRDAGGGTVIEPGPIRSRAALQDFESTALVARSRYLFDDNISLGMLATARFNDDNSQNVLIGADTTWSPSTADQFTAQFLRSETRNPNRPDLLDAWTGQRLTGDASSITWNHSANAWYGNVAYQSYSGGFRAWNGFVTQVGVSSLSAVGVLYFYPDRGPITRFGPSLMLMRTESSTGQLISQMVSPSISIRAAHDTTISLGWQPHVTITTLAGPRSYNAFTMTALSTPFSWMPQASLLLTGGEMVDAVTGEIGDGLSAELSLPLRFSRLEINPAVGYQTLESKTAPGGRTLFTERNLQLSATWHFSSRLNLRVTQQEATFDAAPPFAGLELPSRATSSLSSMLLSYQTSWQTRYYIGALRTVDRTDGLADQRTRRTELFAKISYAFSR